MRLYQGLLPGQSANARLFGNVACFTEADPAYQAVFERQQRVEEANVMPTQFMAWESQ